MIEMGVVELFVAKSFVVFSSHGRLSQKISRVKSRVLFHAKPMGGKGISLKPFPRCPFPTVIHTATTYSTKVTYVPVNFLMLNK
jgi:hypothetical protein